MMKENIKNQILESAKIKNEMVNNGVESIEKAAQLIICLLYTSPSPRDRG